MFTGEHIEHDKGLVDRLQRTEVETLIRAGNVGVLIIEKGVLVGPSIH